MAQIIPFAAAQKRSPSFTDVAAIGFDAVEAYVDFPSTGEPVAELEAKLQRFCNVARWAVGILGQSKPALTAIVLDMDRTDPRHADNLLRDMIEARDLLRILETGANRLGIAMACAIDQAGESPRQALLAGPAKPAAIRFPSAGAEDPIFDLIAEHTAAVEVYVKSCDVVSDLPPGPKCNAAEALLRAASDREHDLLLELLNDWPATLAGVAALLDHLGAPEFLEEARTAPQCRETFLSAALVTDGLKRSAQDFPVRMARIIRRLIATTR